MRGEDFTFSLAGPADEPEIRRLVGAVAMPGTLAVRFEREPDYRLGTSVMGDVCDVLIARHAPSGELAGVVCRSERTVFVNGRERRVGMIGQVRAAPGYRGRWLLHRGLPLLRERGAPDLLYLAVIATDNDRARGVLLERRPPGALRWRRLAGLTTRALLLRRGQGHWGRARALPGVELASAAEVGVGRVVEHLRAEGPRRQLFPAWSEEDLLGGQRLRGMGPADIGVAMRGDRVVGVLGCWDQRGFKQDVVAGYPARLAGLRTAWNGAARLVRAPLLPPMGGAIPQAFAALACVTDDDLGVTRGLIDWVAGRAAARRVGFLLVGLADGDPLAAATGRWPRITYHADLFAVSWTEAVPGGDLDGRVPVYEIGTL